MGFPVRDIVIGLSLSLTGVCSEKVCTFVEKCLKLFRHEGITYTRRCVYDNSHLGSPWCKTRVYPLTGKYDYKFCVPCFEATRQTSTVQTTLANTTKFVIESTENDIMTTQMINTGVDNEDSIAVIASIIIAVLCFTMIIGTLAALWRKQNQPQQNRFRTPVSSSTVEISIGTSASSARADENRFYHSIAFPTSSHSNGIPDNKYESIGRPHAISNASKCLYQTIADIQPRIPTDDDQGYQSVSLVNATHPTEDRQYRRALRIVPTQPEATGADIARSSSMHGYRSGLQTKDISDEGYDDVAVQPEPAYMQPMKIPMPEYMVFL